MRFILMGELRGLQNPVCWRGGDKVHKGGIHDPGETRITWLDQ
jgi:hypothetical protein